MSTNINSNLSKKLKQLVNQFANSNTSTNDKEMNWLINNCHNDQLKNIIPNLTVLSLHIIESINFYEPINCARISENTLIPKGTVSKIAKKLINLNLITVQFLENNKKEKLYQTTDLGKELAILHNDLHSHLNKEMSNFINKYSDPELATLSNFLDDFMKFYF